MAGSATAGVDYTPTSGTVTFGANQTSNTFTIPIVNDKLAEGPETVLLQLSNPTGGAILGPRRTAVLTVVDNDPAGIVRFAATGYTTPDADGMATITLTRTGGTGEGATIQYATGGGGTATPGIHYAPIALTTLPFPGNQPTVTFQVQIHGNTMAGDGNKTVELLLRNAGGGATLGTPNKATLTIANNDAGGALAFVTSAVSVPENSSVQTIAVMRTGGIAGSVTVGIAAADGTAKLGTDYGAPSPAVLTFDPGDTQKTFDVAILSNPMAAASRAFTLKLQDPAGGGTLGSRGAATATVTLTKVGVRFGQTAYTVNEGGVANISVVRSGTGSGTTVSYATEDGNDADASKNAQAGVDYGPIAPTPLTPAFASGQTSKTFAVSTLNNARSGNRTLRLHLSNPTNGEALGQPATATLTILDKQTPELQLAVFTPPGVAIIGKSFAVPNTVRNFSAVAAGASTLQFFLSSDVTWDAGDTLLGQRAVPALGAGATSAASTTLTVPTIPPIQPGDYFIISLVDALGLVVEQNELNNVQSKPVTLVSTLVKTFNVSGDFTTTGCTSLLRNGFRAVQGTVVFSAQTGTALTGTLTLTFPMATLKTTGPVKATLDQAGNLAGTFTYTTTEGSTTVSKGSGTLTGTSNGTSLDPLTLTGTHSFR